MNPNISLLVEMLTDPSLKGLQEAAWTRSMFPPLFLNDPSAKESHLQNSFFVTRIT